MAYHYDPNTALEELKDELALPNPVRLRDMMLRARLDAEHSLELNRLFVEYQKRFGEIEPLAANCCQSWRRFERLLERSAASRRSECPKPDKSLSIDVKG